MNVEGQTVVVTGGASGLGRASVELLAEAGASIAVWDMDQRNGVAVANQVGGCFVPVDVSNAASVEAALSATGDEVGPPRALIHCAGIALGEKTLSHRGPHSVERFERVVDVNLLGTFYCCRAVAAAMSELEPLEDGERGVIITTASIAAVEGQIGQLAYAASKAGVIGMTLPLARDLAKYGIRAVTIVPGLFETALAGTQNEKVLASLRSAIQYPGRFGQPPEFASLALEICRNRMINGEAIRLDGAVRLGAR